MENVVTRPCDCCTTSRFCEPVLSGLDTTLSHDDVLGLIV
jgi:hypothetical protein